MLKLGCVDIFQFLLIVICALRAHVRCTHLTNTLLHYICYITLICCGEHNDLSLIAAASSSSKEYNLPRLLAQISVITDARIFCMFCSASTRPTFCYYV